MTQNPDQGTRIHTRFVRIENGIASAFDNSPFRWKTDSGQRPTDEWLKVQNPAFYGYIQTSVPSYDPETEKVVETPLSQLVPNNVAGTVTQQWQVLELTTNEIAARQASRINAVTAERDRRTAAGFAWNGTMFDARAEDKARIAGAAQLAFMYLVNSGDPVAIDWNDPGSGQPFGWISQNNSIVTMTAPEVIDFAKTAARWETLNVFAARNLKDTPGGVPADYTSNTAYWPDPTNFLE